MEGNVFSCANLQDYLKTLSPLSLDQLYHHPATCLAVFRQLPRLAQHVVLRMLHLPQPILKTTTQSWIQQEKQSEYRESVSALCALRIWESKEMMHSLPLWQLNDKFRASLQQALAGGGKSWAGSTLSPDDEKHAKDIQFLEQYAVERWESVLHYMVGSSDAQAAVSSDIVNVLLKAGLVKEEREAASEASNEEVSITASGFKFLLMSTSAQVWHFMVCYLCMLESKGVDLVECLAFLFQLSFSTLGKCYSTENMSESQLKFLQNLREFGLVYQRKRRCQRYYPTSLAVYLASGVSSAQTESQMQRQGYLIVETNFRLYAYSASYLQIAIVSMFCDMLYRFPNMACGMITRESVREAFQRGITSQQIVEFLQTHAHSQMLLQKPVLPQNLTDQLRLWELERDRLRFTEGVLYSQFLSDEDFAMLRDYAKDNGVLLWEAPKQRFMVVTKEGHDDVKRFWRRRQNRS